MERFQKYRYRYRLCPDAGGIALLSNSMASTVADIVHFFTEMNSEPYLFVSEITHKRYNSETFSKMYPDPAYG